MDLDLSQISGGAELLANKRTPLPRHNAGQKFLKGPIPWSWIAKAANCPGQALQVMMVLWFKAGLQKKRTVKLSYKELAKLGCKRESARRGLKALEDVGLVSVERHPGRSPVVTILEA